MTHTPSTSRTGEAVKDGSTEITGTGNRATLLIRLWTLPRAEVNPAARSWHEESGEVAMLADLVSACRGRLADGYKPQLAAEFSDLPAALMAAKRMQRAMLGFASHQPRSRAAAAIGVFSRLGESTAAGATAREEMQTAGTLMSAATAGQILLTQAAYVEIMRLLPQTARGISSVRLGTGGPALKAYELVWEEPETYVRLRKLVEGMEWAHATASHRSQQTTKRIADPPQLSAGAGASGPGSAEESPQFAAETAAPARVWRRTWAVLGVAAAALITATVLLTTKLDTGHFELPRRGPSPAITKLPATKPPAVNPKPGPSSPERPKPTSAAGDGEKPPTAKSSEDRNETKNTSGEQTNREISKEPVPEPQPAQPPRPAPVRAGREPVEGFYRRDIPGLLEKADRDGGNGKYGSAKYWYGIVLQLEPGNAKARQELSRVIKAEELDQQ